MTPYFCLDHWVVHYPMQVLVCRRRAEPEAAAPAAVYPPVGDADLPQASAPPVTGGWLYHVAVTHGVAPCRLPGCGLRQGAPMRDYSTSDREQHQALIELARARLHDPVDDVGNVYAWGPGVPAWSEHADPDFTPSREEAGL